MNAQPRYQQWGDETRVLIPNTKYVLEMTKRPIFFPDEMVSTGLNINWCTKIDPEYYRFLYNRVGKPWHWFYMNDETNESLIKYLADSWVYTLQQGGVPIGFADLRRDGPSANLAYFGLFPEVVSRGYGTLFLKDMVNRLWQMTDKRVWVYTTQYDHPAAIRTYQKAGFELTETSKFSEYVPYTMAKDLGHV